MIDLILVSLTAFIASLLTFFSGFGLGTMLMPVFAIFFPVEIAIALTAVVHFLNNIFKFFLIGGKTNAKVFLNFGLAAIPAAFAGAFLLVILSGWDKSLQFNLLGSDFLIQPVTAVIGIVMIFFALFEIIPRFKKITFDSSKLWLGGLISGFFGGLSGHQGAMRSAFLINAGMSKEGFIATGITIALVVDIVRMGIYASKYISKGLIDHWLIMLTAVCAAFIGAILGRLLLKKITYQAIRYIVATFLIVIGMGLCIGII